jgi:hypothetical protein
MLLFREVLFRVLFKVLLQRIQRYKTEKKYRNVSPPNLVEFFFCSLFFQTIFTFVNV